MQALPSAAPHTGCRFDMHFLHNLPRLFILICLQSIYKQTDLADLYIQHIYTFIYLYIYIRGWCLFLALLTLCCLSILSISTPD